MSKFQIHHRLFLASLVAISSLSFFVPGPLTAGDDWPQWMGPKRDNVWRETGILEKFPEGGPKVLWRSPINVGYAGPAVAQGKVFAMDFSSSGNVQVDNFARKDFPGTERVICFDEASGKLLWEHAYEVVYSVSYPSGPRCTPIVDGDLVYALGGEGNLTCLEVASGKVVWSKELKKEYQTKSALWGYAGHPLIDGGGTGGRDRRLAGEGGHGVRAGQPSDHYVKAREAQSDGPDGEPEPQDVGFRSFAARGANSLFEVVSRPHSHDRGHHRAQPICLAVS